MKKHLWPILVFGGCVAGNPPSHQQKPMLHGGTIMPAGCNYVVTTKDGASAPTPTSPVLGSDPTPYQIHLGVGGNDPAHSIAFQWRTKDETTLATQVKYGVGTATDQMADGFTFEFSTGFSNDGPLVRMHEVHLCNLQPDTMYSYQVGGVALDGTSKFSPTFQFRTAPPAGDASSQVTVVVLGDSRGGYDALGQLVQQIQTTAAPDLILYSGDAVTLGPVQGEWDSFFNAIEPIARQAPILSAQGNHDLNSVNYYSMFAMPGDEEDYGITYGPFHLTVINDTPIDTADIMGKVKDFLDADLTMNDSAAWKILMHHRPLWSAAVAHGSDMTLQTVWGPIIDAHHVDLVQNGHDHDYERTKPMHGQTPQTSPAAGTVYIVSGGAGADLYDSGMGFWTQISEKTYSFVVLRIRVGMLDMHAYRPDGTTIDTLTITK
jgi:hypothetical protein